MELWDLNQATKIFPGEGNGNPLQCSCLENPMDRGGWWAQLSSVQLLSCVQLFAAHGVTKSRTRLSDFTHTHQDFRASQVVLVVKNPPANAGALREVGLIPG